MIFRLTSDRAGAISFKAYLNSQHPAQLATSRSAEIVLKGNLPGIALRRPLEYVEKVGDTWKYPKIWNNDGSRKPFAKQILYGTEVDDRCMAFESRLRVLHCDGKVISNDSGMEVKDASEVVIALSMASSFNGYQKSPSREGLNPSLRTSRAQQAGNAQLSTDAHNPRLRLQIALRPRIVPDRRRRSFENSAHQLNARLA